MRQANPRSRLLIMVTVVLFWSVSLLLIQERPHPSPESELGVQPSTQAHDRAGPGLDPARAPSPPPPLVLPSVSLLSPIASPAPRLWPSPHSTSSLPSGQSLSTSQRHLRGTQRPLVRHWKLVGAHEPALGPKRCTQVRPGRSGAHWDVHWWSPSAKYVLGVRPEQFAASPRA